MAQGAKIEVLQEGGIGGQRAAQLGGREGLRGLRAFVIHTRLGCSFEEAGAEGEQMESSVLCLEDD